MMWGKVITGDSGTELRRLPRYLLKGDTLHYVHHYSTVFEGV